MNIEPKDVYFSVNADELRDKFKEKCKIRKNVYNTILEKCYYRIQLAASSDKTYLLYPIPKFILGLPAYNLAYCAAYIIYHLRQNGYTAQFFNPNVIFIMWYFEMPNYFDPYPNSTKLLTLNNDTTKKNNYIESNNNNDYSYRSVDDYQPPSNFFFRG